MILIPRKRIVRVQHKRTITMPPDMEPGWLAPQYRDNYVKRCIQLVQRMIACEKCRKRRKYLTHKLRKFQRGNFNIWPAGMFSVIEGDCSFTASNITNLTDFCLGGGCQVWTAARLHNDGDWYSNQGSPGFGSSDGTWQGDCAVAEYDTRWTRVSGTVPNYLVSGSDGVWSLATASKAVGYNGTAFFNAFGNFTLECRDAASLTVLFTDSFSMSVDAEI